MSIVVKLPLTVLIPTYNEEINIARAVKSVAPFVDQVLIVDSWSGDNTLQMAKAVSVNVEIIFVGFTTFANKMNMALTSACIRNDWVMRLDADEAVIDPEHFFVALSDALNGIRGDHAGFYINRRYYFLGKWIRYGGMYPRKVLRIFRKERAQFENRKLDEKMIIDGTASLLNIDIADACQRGFMHWVRKHIMYAKLEAESTNELYNLVQCYDLEFDNKTLENKQRYYRMPLIIRPLFYLTYRLFFQNGVGDGLKGCGYHFLHAFIYREIVDLYIVKFKVRNIIAKLWGRRFIK